MLTADEKAEIIIQKIRKLQSLVKKYSNDDVLHRKVKISPEKHKCTNNNHFHAAKGFQTKKLGEKDINDDILNLGCSLFYRGKKVRHIHNKYIIRHYLDLWISSLIWKLFEKEKDSLHNRDMMALKKDLNTDELVNDPIVKEAEKFIRKLENI